MNNEETIDLTLTWATALRIHGMACAGGSDPDAAVERLTEEGERLDTMLANVIEKPTEISVLTIEGESGKTLVTSGTMERGSALRKAVAAEIRRERNDGGTVETRSRTYASKVNGFYVWPVNDWESVIRVERVTFA